MEEKKKQEANVSKKKLETVKELIELIKNNDTIMIASIKNLPSRQFQEIRKKLRGKAEMKVIKKRIMIRAIETSENKEINKLAEHVQEDSVVLFSKEEAFDLSGFLSENKSPAKAKLGQTTEDDIEVEAGITDLIPGPAISELGNLGIKIAVEDGKIAIKENKVIVKTGEKISGEAASIMAKLDIIPFKIGLEPIAVFDKKSGEIYLDIKIDKEKTTEELKTGAAKALGFAQKIIFYCKETISYFLAKANAEEKTLKKLAPEPKEEKAEEPKAEEVKPEEKTENSDEKKPEEVKEEPKAEEPKAEEKEETQIQEENKPQEDK